ncbi:MAG: isopeptide-forming domain-containing fimbrial protein [Candidatus Gracilibacteria bacterium]
MKKILAKGLIFAMSFTTFAAFPVDVQIAQAAPAASCSYNSVSNPANPFIGEQLVYSVEISNSGADPGFRPIVETILPPEFTYSGPSTFSVGGLSISPTSPTPYTVIDNDGGDPATGDATNPITGEIVQDIAINSTYLVFELPVGSMVPSQLPVSIEITADVANGLTPGVPLANDIASQCTFAFGEDPFNNPSIDPPVTSGFIDLTDIPTVVRVSKATINTNGDEDEVPTGPNFPFDYRIETDIADGETIAPFTISETIPAEIQLLEITSADDDGNGCTITFTPSVGAPQVTSCAALPYTPTGSPPPGGTLSVEYNSLTGTAAGLDADVQFEVYIPDTDSSASDILDPATGSQNSINNSASGSGTHSSGIVSDTTDSDSIVSAESITIQKGVSIFTDVGPTGAQAFSPGDTLEYTVNFQVSDYFSFDQLVVNDVIPDGQTFVSSSASMSITENGVTTSGITFSESAVAEGSIITGPPYNFATCGGCTLAITTDSTDDDDAIDPPGDGETLLLFDISQAMVDATLNGELEGGLVGGASIGEPTSGTLTFQTTINESFVDAQANDTSIDALDTMTNNININGSITTTPPGNFVTNASSAEIAIIGPNFDKSIVAYDDGTIGAPYTTIPSPLMVSPGDEIIFALTVEIPSGDMEDLVITDFLPIPLLDAGQFTGGGCGFDTATLTTQYNPTTAMPASIPAPCMIGYGDNTTGFPGPLPTPTITVDGDINSGNNAIIIDFADDTTFEETPSDGITLELLLNVEVTDSPFDDGLTMVNFSVYETDNSNVSQVIQEPVIIGVETSVPQLEITKGAVATSKAGATFDPATVGPSQITYNSPGSVPSILIVPSFSSSDLDSEPVESTIEDVDAGDLITFMLVIENAGSQDAFDIEFDDTLPAGFVVPGGGLNLQIYEANGSILLPVVNYTGGLFGSGGTSVSMDGAYTLDGLDAATEDGGLNEGGNILIATYDLEVDTDVEPLETITNDASVLSFAAQSGGVNFVTNQEEQFEASSDATIADLSYDKTVFTTDQAHTPGTAVVPGEGVTIGEVVTYSVPVTIPEGTTPNIILNDNIPGRLGYFIDNGVTVSGAADCASPGVPANIFAGTLPTPTVTTPLGAGIASSGADLQITFTDAIASEDNDETNNTFCVQYDVVVLNVGGNVSGTNRQNSVVLTYGTAANTQTSENARIDVLEPDVTITKAVLDPGTNLPPAAGIDANDLLKYRITAEHSGSSDVDAFDLEITDDLTGLKITVNDQFSSDGLDNDGDGLVDGADADEIDGVAAPFWNGTQFTFNNSTTNGADYTQLPLANTIEIEFGFTVDTDVLPNETISNAANLQYTGQPGTPGAPLFERTYNDSDNGDFTIQDIIVSKAITATSETFTGVAEHDGAVEDLAIGESVTYVIDFTIPESSLSNIEIQDMMPDFIRADAVTVLSDGAGTAGARTEQITDDNADTIDDLVTVTYATYDYDNGTDGVDTTTIQIQIDGTLVDHPTGNNNGDQLSNSATIDYDSRSGALPTDSVTIDVVEADLNLTKQVDTNSGDAGDIRRYTITVDHDATTASDAFDLEITDTLPAGVTAVGDFDTDGLDNDGDGLVDGADADELAGGAAPFYNAGLDAFTWNASTTNNSDFDQLIQAGTITLSFDVQLDAGVSPGQVITNTAQVNWNSLPADADPDERSDNDTGFVQITVDNIALSKSVFSTDFTETGTSQFDGGLEDLAIGEEVRYRITVAIPEGSTTGFEIEDVQLPGIEIQSGSLISDDGVVHTLSPNISISDANVVDGINDTISFDFGDLTNAPDADTEAITVEVVALVIDDPTNSPTNNPFANTASSIIDSMVVDFQNAEVEVVEPSINFTKTVAPTTGDSGDDLVYTITIDNVGSGPAFDIEINDTVPANMTVTTGFDSDGLDNNGDGADGDANESAGTFFSGPSDFTWNAATTGNPLFSQLNPGASFTLEYKVTLGAGVSAGNTLVNNATIDYDSAPGTNAEQRAFNDSDDATVTVPFTGDMVKELRDADTDKTIADTIPYRITLDIPEGTVDPLTVTDTLPAGLAYIPGSATIIESNEPALSFSGSPATPTQVPTSATIGAGTSQTLTFNFGTVVNTDVNNATTEQISIEYDVVVLNTSDNAAGGSQVNSASADFDGTVIGPLGAPSIDIVEPDMQISKTSTYVNGNTITYFISVSHQSAGEPSAHDVILTDTLPAGVTYNGNITSTNGPVPTVNTTNFPVIMFDIDEINGTFTGGNPVTFSFDVEVDLGVASGTILTNNIDMEYTGQDGTMSDVIPGNDLSNERTGDTGDPGGTENDYTRSDNLDVTVTRSDLSTSTKVADDLNGGDLEINDIIEYTINIINTGNSAATGVRVTDDIPEHVNSFTVISTPPGSTDASVSAPAGTNGNGFLDITGINLDASGGANDTAQVVFQVAVDLSLPTGTPITNTATCLPGMQGGNGCTANSVIGVLAPVLDITKEALPLGVKKLGDTVEFTITVNNTGDAPSTNTTITDAIPAGLSYTAGSLILDGNPLTDILDADEGDYNDTTPDTITVVVPSIPNPGTSEIKFSTTVAVDTDTSITNIANVVDDQGSTLSDDEQIVIEEDDGTRGGGGRPGAYHPGTEGLFSDDEGNVRDDALACETEFLPDFSSNACLELDADREIQFNDLPADDDASRFITTLKNTRIIETGDYVFSGTGNHSTGKQQSKFQSGTWEFQPDRNATRFEVVKTVLVSNCIPIEDTIPVPTNGFRFADIPVDIPPSDEVNNFIARVFYTAYKHGVVTGYADGFARPDSVATVAETTALGLRAGHAIPAGYNLESDPWYETYMDFARLNGIFNGLEFGPNDKLIRKDFAKILTRIMAYNPNPQIHGYIERVDMENQEFISDIPAEKPIPDMSIFEYDPLTCRVQNACLEHVPDRPLSFTDIPEIDWAYPYIETLRTTRIIEDGDFIASGNGNHSTGVQQSKFRSGSWNYQPDRATTRLELIKVALVSNCISIPDKVPAPVDGFEFTDLPIKNNGTNELENFTERVFYTAYNEGLFGGDANGLASPQDPITYEEALSILTKASFDTQESYNGPNLPFKINHRNFERTDGICLWLRGIGGIRGSNIPQFKATQAEQKWQK